MDEGASGKECENRLKIQLEELSFNSQLTYRISYRHQRTLLFLQVIPSSQLGRSHTLTFSQASRVQQKVENAFMLEESQDHMENTAQEEYFFQEQAEKQALNSNGSKEGAIIFTFIFHDGLYPFEAPYITATLPVFCKSIQDHWPRVDDARNLYYDIMNTQYWWPLLSLKHIISQLPVFAQYLMQSVHRGPKYGQFEQDTPLYLQDMMEVSPHFTPEKLLLKKGKGPLASYHLRWAYFTFSGLAMLEEESPNKFYVQCLIGVQQMRKVESAIENGNCKLQLETSEGQQYKVKWQTKSLPNYFCLFQLYYKAIVEEKGERRAQRLIEIYSQIIVEAHHLNLPCATQWAKRKIVYIASTLS